MRTTLDIDDDVLLAVKERARRENRTAGAVISELARQALTAPRSAVMAESTAAYGFAPFAPRGAVITTELIDRRRAPRLTRHTNSGRKVRASWTTR